MAASGDPTASHRRFRQLLPAGAESEQQGQWMDRPTTSLPTDIPKRRPTAAACEECRKLKTKCDGARPTCSKCAYRGVGCHYDARESETHLQGLKRKFNDLTDKISVYEELFDVLRARPEDESRMVLTKIQAGVSAETIIRQIKEGDLLLQLSLGPEARSRYDFPYISRMPGHLRIPSNTYLDSVLYESTFASTSSIPGAEIASRLYQSPYVKPYHAAEMVDAQLAVAAPSKWTKVSSNDTMLRRLLEKYFLHEYPRYVAFHKDYFLADMNSGGHTHCSSLLVNAVLAAACHSDQSIPDRSRYWNPHGLGYKFFAEARRLWELEAGKRRLTTIQAAIVMNVAYAVDGVDRVGLSYLFQAVKLARDMRLFSTLQYSGQGGNDAYLFTAWALFNWQSIQSYYFFRLPLIPECPPPLPDINPNVDFYPETWIRYPLDRTLFPLYFGHSFRALCELRAIMNELTLEIFDEANPRKKLSWDRAIAYRNRLQNWYIGLPTQLSPRSIAMPAHLTIHAEYFSTLITLFSAQTQLDSMQPEHVSISERKTIMQDVIADATIRLETLVRLYYLRHGYEWYDSFMMQFLIMLANSAMEALQNSARSPLDHDEEEEEVLRSTLILCLKGVHDQGKNFHLAAVVYGVLRGQLREKDRLLLDKHVDSASPAQDSKDTSHMLQAQWVVPISKRNDDPDGSRLENLLADYQQLSVNAENAASDASLTP